MHSKKKHVSVAVILVFFISATFFLFSDEKEIILKASELMGKKE